MSFYNLPTDLITTIYDVLPLDDIYKLHDLCTSYISELRKYENIKIKYYYKNKLFDYINNEFIEIIA